MTSLTTRSRLQLDIGFVVSGRRGRLPSESDVRLYIFESTRESARSKNSNKLESLCVCVCDIARGYENGQEKTIAAAVKRHKFVTVFGAKRSQRSSNVNVLDATLRKSHVETGDFQSI